MSTAPATRARLEGSSSRRARRRLLRTRDIVTAIAFMLPALVVYGMYVLYPVFQSVGYSLYEWAGPGRVPTYVGWENYQAMLADPLFLKALGNTLFVLVASLLLQIPVGVYLATIITGPIRARRAWRGMYFIPTLMSTVAIGILWGYVYNPNYGILNTVLKAIGLGELAQGWLGQSSTALPAVMVTLVWQWAPFWMIIAAAGISGIPTEIYEAASIDGASRLKQFWLITLPILKPIIITISILAIIGSVKAFDLVYVMTRGGPNSSTELLATYMFKQGFQNYKFGYASAIAVAMLVIALVLTCVVLARTWRSAKQRKAGQ